MKKHLFVTILALAFLGCEEVPPYIDFNPPVKTKDTTYILTTPPAAQHKAVLLEDITGVRCNNCPKAAQRAKDILAAKTEDSVVLIGLYTTHLENFTKPWDGFENLTTNYSFQIVDFLGAPPGLPTGYVDRAIILPQTVRFNSYTTWANLVNNRLKLSTPVNISLNKTLNGRELKLEMNLTYTQNVSNNHQYSLYITEDNIVGKQTMPDGAGEKDDYVHNHVLRYAFGLAAGNNINESLVAGRVIIKELDYTFPANFKIEDCHVVCVVTDATTNEVVNVREISLK